MVLAVVHAIQENDVKGLIRYLLYTIALAGAFLVIKDLNIIKTFMTSCGPGRTSRPVCRHKPRSFGSFIGP